MKNRDKADLLVGTWRHAEVSTEVTVSLDCADFIVSAVDTDDAEKFAVSDVAWDGASLSFVTHMPSTGTTVKNRLTPKTNSTVDFEICYTEEWFKKTNNVNPISRS